MFPQILGQLGHFFITSLISLFVIIDPPGNVLPFLALAGGLSPRQSRDLALRACLYAFLILVSFIVLGRLILSFFGISLAAFQIAGGLILFRIAFDMLEGRGHFQRLDTSSSLKATDYRDIALSPLAIPLVMAATYLSFRFADGVLRHLKESGIRLFTRLMGLILAALAVQFVLSGIRAAFPGLGG
jgi:multiple antibiotic resistance protein